MVQISGNPIALECAHFVDAVDEELACPICLRVVVSPVQCKEGHVFCKGCIETALCEKEECPMDRSALQVADLRPVPAVEQAVNNKKIRCPHAGQHTDEEGGCDWVGKVRERQKHIDTECGYTFVPCPHDGCVVRVQRRAVEEHAASCEQRAEACEHCGEGVAVSQRAQHEQVCPQVSVECAFKDVGCTAPSMLRKDVSAHEAEAAGSHATLALAAQKEGRERERALEAAASALRAEAEEERLEAAEDARLQAAETETAAAHHAEERRELVERATKAEDRCKNTVVTDLWVIDRVRERLSNKASCTHRVSLSQDKDDKKTVTIEVRFSSRDVIFYVTGNLQYPSVSVLLYNANAMDKPEEVAKPTYGTGCVTVHSSTLHEKYLSGADCITLTTRLSAGQ